MCDEIADCGHSAERRIRLLPPRRREPRNSAATEDRAATGVELGIAEIGAMVGELIRQGRPLPVVLTSLCQLLDATVKGYCSSVLLLDRTGAKVQKAVGPSLPASYMKQLEGRRVSWIETPPGATINAQIPVIVLDRASDTLRESQESAPAAAPGFRLQEVSPILSLTGEPLGIFAVYQREGNPEVTHHHSALISRFTHVTSAAIERMRGDEALKRSAARLEMAQQLSATYCFSWRVETDEISCPKELCRLFDLEPGRCAGDTRAARRSCPFRRPPVIP